MTESLPPDFTDILADFAPAYSTSGTYAVGDYVMHQGQFYVCNTAIDTPEDPFEADHWTAVPVGDELKKIIGHVYPALAMKAADLEYTPFTDSTAIDYSDGEPVSSAIGLRATDYIDVSMYKRLIYSQCRFQYDNAGGIAFYDT